MDRLDTTDTAKSSLRLKRKRADWDDELRARFLRLTPIRCSSAEALVLTAKRFPHKRIMSMQLLP